MKYIHNIDTSTPGARISQPQQPWLKVIFFLRGSTFDLSNVRFGRESGRYVNYVLFVLFQMCPVWKYIRIKS